MPILPIRFTLHQILIQFTIIKSAAFTSAHHNQKGICPAGPRPFKCFSPLDVHSMASRPCQSRAFHTAFISWSFCQNLLNAQLLKSKCFVITIHSLVMFLFSRFWQRSPHRRCRRHRRASSTTTSSCQPWREPNNFGNGSNSNQHESTALWWWPLHRACWRLWCCLRWLQCNVSVGKYWHFKYIFHFQCNFTTFQAHAKWFIMCEICGNVAKIRRRKTRRSHNDWW